MGKDARVSDEVVDHLEKVVAAMGAVGRANARRQKLIARQMGVSTRRLQLAARQLRKRGVPLVSTCDPPLGMYVAETNDEMESYLRQLHARIKGNAETFSDIRDIQRRRIAAMPVEPGGQRRLACDW